MLPKIEHQLGGKVPSTPFTRYFGRVRFRMIKQIVIHCCNVSNEVYARCVRKHMLTHVECVDTYVSVQCKASWLGCMITSTSDKMMAGLNPPHPPQTK